MPLDLVRLKQFVTVAQERNMRAAAKVLSITQPTISRKIASMEREFGCRFFSRSPTGVELTASGWVLLEVAIKVLKDVEDGERTIRHAVAAEKAKRAAKSRRS